MRRLKSLRASPHWSHGELQTRAMAACSRKADMRELKQGCWPRSVGHHTAAAPLSWSLASSGRAELQHHEASRSTSSAAPPYWAEERGMAQE